MKKQKSISCREAATELGCSLHMVYKLFDTGELQGYKEGQTRFIYASSLDEYRKRHSNDTAVQARINRG